MLNYQRVSVKQCRIQMILGHNRTVGVEGASATQLFSRGPVFREPRNQLEPPWLVVVSVFVKRITGR